MHISMYSCKKYIYYLFLFLNLCLRESEKTREREKKKVAFVIYTSTCDSFFSVKLLLFKFVSFREICGKKSTFHWAAPLWVEYIYIYWRRLAAGLKLEKVGRETGRKRRKTLRRCISIDLIILNCVNNRNVRNRE